MEIDVSDEKVLTKEIAEQLLPDLDAYEDSMNLSEFTAIEDDAAESLSKHQRERESAYRDGQEHCVAWDLDLD